VRRLPGARVIPPLPWKHLAALAAALALFIGGFFTGRRTAKPIPQTLTISAAPRQAVDLSPAGERGTVTAPAIHTGKPTPPPAAPANLAPLGEHLSTTTATTGEAAPEGSRFRWALYGTTAGQTLNLRPVVWAETPEGKRLELAAETTAQTVDIPIQAARPRSWAVSCLVDYERGDRPRLVYLAQHDRGHIRLTVGAAKHRAMVGIGVTW